MKLKEGYVLWLASWYPNKYEPFLGDFIQRHAQATAEYIPVTVFHFVQSGAGQHQDQQPETFQQTGKLTECIYYPAYTPGKGALLNKIRYNFQFYAAAKQRLAKHFAEHGLPLAVHVHVPVKAGNLALWIKRKWGIPYLVSEQASHYLPAAPDAYMHRSRLYQWQVRRIFSQAIAVSNVSATIGKLLKQLFRLQRVHTIHNLVDTNQFFFKPYSKTQFTFIHVSALNEQKNITGLLRAFAQLAFTHHQWKLVLVGPANEEVKKQVQDLGLSPYVHLKGEIPYSMVAEAMRQADVFVLFSRHENFPCVVVEALCCGLPVVAANVAGVGEAVNKLNGILVETGDETALTRALADMLTHSAQYNREQIAADAAALYSRPVIGGQIFNLYRTYFGVGEQ